jgi:hypothetical protein
MRRVTRLAALSALPACLLLTAACTAGGGAGWTYAPLGPTPPPTAGTPAPGTPGPGVSVPPGNVVDVELTGSLTILSDGAPLSELHVVDGETYLFRVDNTAGLSHDFYLGPADRLQGNDVAGLPGLEEWESGVREFSWTAGHDADDWQFACTVLGHYASMHGSLVIDSASQ